MSIGKQSLTGLCAWLLLALTLNTWAQAPTLEPPRVQLVDRNHVKTVGPVARISRTDIEDTQGLPSPDTHQGAGQRGVQAQGLGRLIAVGAASHSARRVTPAVAVKHFDKPTQLAWAWARYHKAELTRLGDVR